VRLTDIVIYPVKSCAGSSLAEVTLDRFGPRGDRRWMVVNDNGGFLTQRDLPAMCRSKTPNGAGVERSRPGPGCGR
jgi:uncharacterized protein YcbX